MAISSVAVLNGDGVDANAAAVRQSTAKDYLAAVANDDNSTSVAASFKSSSISFISQSGQARLSIDSFQALASAIQNLNVPPTVGDFKVAVQGVVSGLNGLRLSLANAAVANANFREQQRAEKALEAVDRATSASKANDFVSSLQKIGVDRQSDGGFTVNQKQLSKAFNEDKQGAFSTLTDFASQVSKAAETPSSEDGKKIKDAKRNRQADQANAQSSQDTTQSTQQQGINQPVDGNSFQQQLAGASSFAARSAVTSYLTVAL